jgi:phosphatidate cytidylyltransferase
LTEKDPSLGRKAPNAHVKRWLTAIVALPIVVYAIAAAPLWFFFLLITCFSILGAEEIQRLLEPQTPLAIRILSHILAILFFGAVYMRELMLLPFLLCLWAMLPMTYLLFKSNEYDASVTSLIGKSTIVPLYIFLPLAMMASIRMRPNGIVWVFFLLAVVFATDTGSFYCGRLLGRKRLYEKASPKKTWEGAIGGTALALFVSFVYAMLFSLIGKAEALLLGFFMSVAGQVGDLAESMLKRCHAAKDSGGLLPGHGGVLDRLDSILFASPVLYLGLSFL